MGALWLWACARAAGDVQAAEAGLESHSLPPAAGWWDTTPHTIVKWRQQQREELEHQRLIEDPGKSSRMAVLVCVAAAYVTADGDLAVLMAPRPPGQPWVVPEQRSVSE